MKTTVSAADTAAVVAIVAMSAILSGVGMTLLSAPHNMRDRLAALQSKAEDIAQVLRPRSYTTGSANEICANAAGAAEALRSRMTRFGEQQALTLGAVTITPDPAGRSGLTPVRIRFQAKGDYEAAIGLLGLLEQSEPRVYADTADLVSNTSSVSLTFSGRMFCAS